MIVIYHLVAWLTGLLTGLVVDSGDGVTHVVCITYMYFGQRLAICFDCAQFSFRRVIYIQLCCQAILIVHLGGSLASLFTVVFAL